MKKICLFLTILCLCSSNVIAQDSLSFGDEDQGGYGQDGGYGDEQGQGQKPKGGTGEKRKDVTTQMEVMGHTELSKEEVCKTKCNMGFSNCYRLKTDRGGCYKEQQECLGKCGGEQEPGFGEDQGGGGGEYGF